MVGHLDYGDVFSSTTLAIRDAYLGVVLRMPPIVDGGAFANMGRMNGDSPLAGTRGCSSVAMFTASRAAICSR
jgi:hypothetical protein